MAGKRLASDEEKEEKTMQKNYYTLVAEKDEDGEDIQVCYQQSADSPEQAKEWLISSHTFTSDQVAQVEMKEQKANNLYGVVRHCASNEYRILQNCHSTVSYIFYSDWPVENTIEITRSVSRMHFDQVAWNLPLDQAQSVCEKFQNTYACDEDVDDFLKSKGWLQE